MRPLLLLILTSLSCFAQVVTLSNANVSGTWNTIPFASPTSIPGMAYYWDYSDIAVGSTVPSWTDKIQGKVLSNSVAGSRPTNSSSGVYFNNTTFLTNLSVFSFGPKASVWIVFNLRVLQSSTFIAYAGSGYAGFYITSSKFNVYHSAANHLATSTLASGVTYDTLYAWGNVYTNAVFSSTVTTNSAAQNVNNFGGVYSGLSPLDGYIKFIGVWTNTQLTASDAVTLYNYSTSH